MKNPREILNFLREFNIDAIPHTDAGLSDHLLGTHGILTRWACSDEVCLAGLCHSVYGTESYQRQTVPLPQRKKLQEIIGNPAEHLAYLFGAHKKDSLWENLDRSADFSIVDRFTDAATQINDSTLNDLITLTLANWLEQRPRVDIKHWYIRKDEFVNSKNRLPPQAWQEFRAAYGLD